jgi:hypothetical protein
MADLTNKVKSCSTGIKTYSVEDIATILGIHKKTAYILCKKNYFITKKIGKSIRINKKSFDCWLNS